jgi:NAD(P)-dependent dehydrogenase (short-subunit alcohol dehydrogenase family)
VTVVDRFAGRTAIVSGAGSGIGREIAVRLAAEGARVVAGDVDAAALESLAAAAPVTVVPGDSAVEGTADRLVEAAERCGDGVDLVVNNAGLLRPGPTETYATADWLRTVDVNLTGYFYLARAAGSAMIGRGGGAILNVASIAGVAAAPESAAYVATKHGVIGLTRALAADWACHGIRVNALAPGLTRTPMVAEFADRSPQRYAAREARVPLGRAAEASEQAAIALFLLSPEASYVTGQVVVADGGGQALYSGYDAPAVTNGAVPRR